MGLLDVKQLKRDGNGDPYLKQQFPRIYGALAGLLTAPDQLGGSVLDANTIAARDAAEYTYPPGLLASAGGMAKGAGLMAMAIDPKAQKKLVQGLLGSGNTERYRLGDIKPKQATQAYNMGGKPVGDSLDVFASPEILEEHARLARIKNNNFKGEEVGLFAKQSMRPDSEVIAPATSSDYPLLRSVKMTDPVTGLTYHAEMPIKPVDDGFEAISIIPQGLPARKKPR